MIPQGRFRVRSRLRLGSIAVSARISGVTKLLIKTNKFYFSSIIFSWYITNPFLDLFRPTADLAGFFQQMLRSFQRNCLLRWNFSHSSQRKVITFVTVQTLLIILTLLTPPFGMSKGAFPFHNNISLFYFF